MTVTTDHFISPKLLVPIQDNKNNDTLRFWIDAFFKFEASSAARSQKEQLRDLELFRNFVIDKEGSDLRKYWTPRLSREFQNYLKAETIEGRRRWSDRTINRMFASLKVLAKWIDFVCTRPEFGFDMFVLGNPMRKMKGISIGNRLEIERALTDSQRRAILNAADRLLVTDGKSKDRKRFAKLDLTEKPRRLDARPFRDRAIIYLLCGSPIRRGAVSKLRLNDVNFKKKQLAVEEKGGILQIYPITEEALNAISDYIKNEREKDNQIWKASFVFLGLPGKPLSAPGLSPRSINLIWNEICKNAEVEGKTCHSTRHYWGRRIADKTQNPAAVQLALGHRNPATSVQYMRVGYKEIEKVMEE